MMVIVLGEGHDDCDDDRHGDSDSDGDGDDGGDGGGTCPPSRERQVCPFKSNKVYVTIASEGHE